MTHNEMVRLLGQAHFLIHDMTRRGMTHNSLAMQWLEEFERKVGENAREEKDNDSE